MVCGVEYLGSEPQSLHYYRAIIIFCGTRERNRGYALLMMANKLETVLYRPLNFFFLLLSYCRIRSCELRLLKANKATNLRALLSIYIKTKDA